MLPAHVAVDLIRSAHTSATTVGGLRTRQTAVIGESEPPFAYHKSVVSSSNRTDHTTLHAQFSSDQSIHLNHSRKRITKHIYVGYCHPLSIMMKALRGKLEKPVANEVHIFQICNTEVQAVASPRSCGPCPTYSWSYNNGRWSQNPSHCNGCGVRASVRLS